MGGCGYVRRLCVSFKVIVNGGVCMWVIHMCTCMYDISFISCVMCSVSFKYVVFMFMVCVCRLMIGDSDMDVSMYVGEVWVVCCC